MLLYIDVHRYVGADTERRSTAIGILAWLVLGLIAGFLASVVMKGGGYGVVGDIVVGIIGALLGGFVFGLLTGNANPVNNLDIGSIFVAFVGACLLIAILRAVSGRRVAR